jgi:hypothetical protein
MVERRSEERNAQTRAREERACFARPAAERACSRCDRGERLVYGSCALMRRRFALQLGLLIVGSIAFSACGSCGWFPLLPDKRTPVDRAHELTARCREDAGPLAVDALSPAIVESVEPAYVRMNQGAGGDTRLRGANLHMRPTLTIPPAVLQRALECHEARVTLGEAAELPEDPYVLAGSWLDIHVSSEEEGLVATVATDSIDDARRVVDRARKFVTLR